MGPFGPQDQRFWLPGNKGFDCHLSGAASQKKSLTHKTLSGVLAAPPSTERPEFLMAQYGNECPSTDASVNKKLTLQKLPLKMPELSVWSKHVCNCRKEILSHVFCKWLITNSWFWLWHRKRKMTWPFGADGQNLKERCSSGSSFMALRTFAMLSGLEDIGLTLSSGLAFFGPYTNNMRFETDERCRHLGFYVDVLGCCKVTRHGLRGTQVFVGSLFPHAAADSHTCWSSVEPSHALWLLQFCLSVMQCSV